MSKPYENRRFPWALEWTAQGLSRRYGHTMRLWTGEGDVAAFSTAWKGPRPSWRASAIAGRASRPVSALLLAAPRAGPRAGSPGGRCCPRRGGIERA